MGTHVCKQRVWRNNFNTKKINNLLNKNSSLPIKICLDVDHGNRQSSDYEADPYNWLNELAKYAYCLHLKQVKKNYHSSHLVFTRKKIIEQV